MTTISTIENETRRELILADYALLAKGMLLEGDLANEQGLCCANHTDEEIVLDQIRWNHFICPKCGSDYSIGRKIISVNRT